MDMNNKENENVEVLDDFVIDSSSQVNVEPVSVEPVPMPTVEPVAAFDEPAPVPIMEPVEPVVEPVTIPAVEPASDPAMAAVNESMDLMSDFPTTAQEVSEPVVETPVSVVPVVPVAPAMEQQTVEVEPVVASEPVLETPVSATLESNNIENNVGINNDQNVVPEYDASASVTQASEQQKVKGGKNDTLIFIGILLVIIAATIIALPFIFNAL